ncbi:MAG TPA: type II secretion system protein GspG [Pyrinomonadaceae bacterium]|nr:type II secretion system protein GspG [Pyrinomonadaceae bacterium]
MRHTTRRTIFILSVCAALCAFAAGSVRGIAAPAAEKAIKRDEARKLIAAVSVLELNKEAVTIREISPPGAVATVLAGVKLGFRFVRDEAGAWRVADVRTGDRQWESLNLLGRALGGVQIAYTRAELGGEQMAAARAELDAFAAELAALGKNKAAATGNATESQTVGNNQNQPPKELRRGALSVKNPEAALAPIGSMAVVELEVETSVDFVRDARGRWQVARVRFGSGGGRVFEAFDAFERALNTEKIARARADLRSLAALLEVYRRARGFYVVAETSADLVDHLNPRYTTAFIRFDPWHRPYEYKGGREGFTLRSLGADGKPNTADDVGVGRRWATLP